MSKGTTDSSEHHKSGGRRFDLYPDIGTYFSPDGSPNLETFRTHIQDNLKNFLKGTKDRDEFEIVAGEWLSSLLEKITGSLEEKGLGEEAVLLFRAAIEEASLLNIRKIPIHPDQLRLIFSLTQPSSQKGKKPAAFGNRENIFNAALKLFVEKGFHNTTVDEIADLSGVGKGTIYRNFKNKEDLLEQLISERTSEIVTLFSEMLEKENDIVKLVELVISSWLRFIEDNHLLYRLIQKEEIMYKPDGKTMFYNTIVRRLPMLKERVVALNAEGKVKTTNFYTAFYGVMGFIDGVVYKWLQSNMEYSLCDELPVVLEVLLNGFIGEKAGGKRYYIPPEEQGQ